MKNARTNFFNLDKSLANRVSEFVRLTQTADELRTNFKIDAEKLQKKIDAPEKLKGSAMKPEEYELVCSEAEDAKVALVNLEIALAEALDAKAKFELSESDKALYKAYKTNFDKESLHFELMDAIDAWMSPYGKLERTDVVDIIRALGGKRQNSIKARVNSGYTEFTKMRPRLDILKTFYGVLAEKMIKAGTIKPDAIPQNILDYYKPVEKTDKKK